MSSCCCGTRASLNKMPKKKENLGETQTINTKAKKSSKSNNFLFYIIHRTLKSIPICSRSTSDNELNLIQHRRIDLLRSISISISFVFYFIQIFKAIQYLALSKIM